MYQALKRLFDLCAASIALLLFLPFGIIISFWIISESSGGVFYKQTRVGKNGVPFNLLKFRSMRSNADREGKITIGNDHRVTKSGRFIRKYKLDEIPQLINILKGEMSVVGPRPEVAEYVSLYTKDQQKVLTVLPGLTDYASLEFINEQELLGEAEDPNLLYVQEIMPKKLALNLKYIEERSLKVDLKLIFQTIGRIV
jgi:lipopolysaccharide/colanic/teichoic acid biosynthesis glycosyltransferase